MNSKSIQNQSSKEVEYKWRVDSVRDYHRFLKRAESLGAQFSNVRDVQICDQYLDTADHFFQKVHLACRIRRQDQKTELTLKSLVEPKQGLFVRSETTVKFPQGLSQKAALKYSQDYFFEKIEPLFEILNRRKICTLTLPCGTIIETSCDRVVIVHQGKRVKMREIEMELKSGSEESFKAFVNDIFSLKLKESLSSKYEMAMKHLSKEKRISVRQEDFHTMANRILAVNFKKFKKNGELMRTTYPQTEAIHDMRVATRRLQTAIYIFKKQFSAKTGKIGRKLKKLFHLLGRKRDLDLFFEFIAKTLHIEPLSSSELAEQMEIAQKNIVLWLNSKSYAKLLKKLKGLRVFALKDGENFFYLWRKWIQKALHQVIKIAPFIHPEVDDQVLHQLRISLKRLRYICEFFTPLFSIAICSLEPLIEKTKKIQDILGDYHDAIAGISKLKSDPELFSLEKIEKITKAYERKAQQARRLFFKTWRNYWFGKGFRRTNPTSAIELILT